MGSGTPSPASAFLGWGVLSWGTVVSPLFSLPRPQRPGEDGDHGEDGDRGEDGDHGNRRLMRGLSSGTRTPKHALIYFNPFFFLVVLFDFFLVLFWFFCLVLFCFVFLNSWPMGDSPWLVPPPGPARVSLLAALRRSL